MKNIFINITVNLQSLLKLSHQSNVNTNKSDIVCNYSNNYYGDQQCLPVKD